MSFSKKFNLQENIPLQIDSMTSELRSALWNPVYMALWDSDRNNFRYQDLTAKIWIYLLEWHIEDLISLGSYQAKERIKRHFNKASWNKIYDLIATTIEYYISIDANVNYIQSTFNSTLERHNSAYRLRNGEFIRITDPALIETISGVFSNSLFAHEVKEELSKSITKLSERGEVKNPYIYNESAEAAIHMLEAYLKGKTGAATFSNAIRDLKKDSKIEKTLFDGLDKLYAFANDQVRHAAKASNKQIVLEYSDALYILHCSLALINYLEYPGKLFQLADKVNKEKDA